MLYRGVNHHPPIAIAEVAHDVVPFGDDGKDVVPADLAEQNALVKPALGFGPMRQIDQGVDDIQNGGSPVAQGVDPPPPIASTLNERGREWVRTPVNPPGELII